MSGQYQVYFGCRLIVIIVRLVVQYNAVFRGVQILRQFLHTCPRTSLLLFRAVLTPDQVKTVIDQFHIVLQHMHSIFFQFFYQVVSVHGIPDHNIPCHDFRTQNIPHMLD